MLRYELETVREKAATSNVFEEMTIRQAAHLEKCKQTEEKCAGIMASRAARKSAHESVARENDKLSRQMRELQMMIQKQSCIESLTEINGSKQDQRRETALLSYSSNICFLYVFMLRAVTPKKICKTFVSTFPLIVIRVRTFSMDVTYVWGLR